MSRLRASHPSVRVAQVAAMLLAVVVSFLAAPVPNASAVNATANQKFMTLNFAGSYLNNGKNTKIPALAAAITDYRPGVVMVQEICKSQALALVSQSKVKGYELKVEYTSTVGAGKYCTDIGNAIFVPATASFDTNTKHESHVYTNAEGKKGGQRITCIDTVGAFAYRTTVCNTHLSPAVKGTKTEVDARNQRIADEVRNATNIAEARSTGKPMVFGGDFNRNPTLNAMSPVYHKGKSAKDQPSSGRFEEIDQCGAANPRALNSGCNTATHTSGQKIDYIFLKQAFFKGLDARVLTTDFGSDHSLLRGVATICQTADC